MILAAGAAAAAVAAGSLGIYAYSRAKVSTKSIAVEARLSPDATNPPNEKKSENQSNVGAPDLQSPETSGIKKEVSRSIPKAELEKSKRELRTLLVEKDMVSAALTKLYEMEAAKEITKSERELLGAKYVAELKVLDEKINKVDAFIQIGDLETLRNQLLQLVEQKIDSIDRRIESTRKLAEPLIAEMTKNRMSAPVPAPQVATVDETQRGTPIPDISDMLHNEKPEPRIDPVRQPEIVATAPLPTTSGPKTTGASVPAERKRPADKVEELQKEILEALDRLERLDVDST